MRLIAKFFSVSVVLVFLSISSFGSDQSGQIQLKTGEMGFLTFLEMVSEKLDLQIDASGLGTHLRSVVIPDMGPLSPDRTKALILTVLSQQGFTWIHDTSTDLYRVLPLRDARDQETPMITDPAQLPDNDLLVTYFMPMEHVSPEYIARIMRSFMPPNSRIIPDVATNSVIITDSSRNIMKLKKLIQQVDTPQTAKNSSEWLKGWAKKAESNCPDQVETSRNLQPGILITLFSLIALVIGFLFRGYVIRRIEGGL